MAIERRFIRENVKNAALDEYLASTLQRAGYGGMDLKRSPLGTRIIVRIERPGLVIGRKGRSIKRLTKQVESEFGMENPQIEVEEIDRPELNANVMASKIANSLVKGVNFRRASYGALRRIMESGARGVEIVISGKITGGRSRSVRFAHGYLKKCGMPAIEQVNEGYAVAKMKVGVLGVNVKIMPPDAELPDEIEFIEPAIEEELEPQLPEPKPQPDQKSAAKKSPGSDKKPEKKREKPPQKRKRKRRPPKKAGQKPKKAGQKPKKESNKKSQEKSNKAKKEKEGE
ncbi:MAG: 30S ribosomal protein S3 [Candidatus Methanofastidiosia archaeon]|jgi:small subunit ribosomal protein S3